MCVALPCKLIEIEGNRGLAEIGGSRVKTRLDMLPDAQLGDHVLVHAGFAIQLLDEREARGTLELFREVARAVDDEQKGGPR